MKKNYPKICDEISAIMRGELGVTEDAGRNVDKAGRIQEYWEAAQDSRVNKWLQRVPGTEHRDEWCAAFASWVYSEVGLGMEHRYGSGFPGCGVMIQHLEACDAWHDYRDAEPVPGDLIFLDWQKLPRQLKPNVKITAKRAMQVVDHVGLVESVLYDDAGAIKGVITIEGNWRNGVNRTSRMFSEGNVLGFGCLL